MNGSSGDYYGVLIDSAGGSFLAYCGAGEAPMLFTRYSEAVKYRRELKDHLASTLRIVRVRAEFSVLTRV